MIPLGYMAKFVATQPEWLQSSGVTDIFSVSSCISKDFCEWIDGWKHNGYWFFDNPTLIQEIASGKTIDLSTATWFYYEAFEEEYSDSGWRTFTPEPSFPLQVANPVDRVMRGYDVVTFSCGNSAECSPLSCNHLAKEIPVNRFCLFDSLEAARASVDSGCFNNSEPGPYRIISVSTLTPEKFPKIRPAAEAKLRILDKGVR